MNRCRLKNILTLLCIIVLPACYVEAELPSSSSNAEIEEHPLASNGRYLALSPGGNATFSYLPDSEQRAQNLWVRLRCLAGVDSIRLSASIFEDSPDDTVIEVDSTITCSNRESEWFWSPFTDNGQVITFDQTPQYQLNIKNSSSTDDLHIDKIAVLDDGSDAPLGVSLPAANIAKPDAEAESNITSGANWIAQSSNIAWAKQVALSTEPDDSTVGGLSFTFDELPSAGPYWVWLRADVAGDSAGRYILSANGEVITHPEDANRAHTVRDFAELEWQRAGITKGRRLDTTVGAVNPNGDDFYTLTLKIAALDPGIIIDRILVTNGAHVLPELWSIHDPLTELWPAGGNIDLVTERSHQYVAFYNPNRKVTVAHRRLFKNEWQFHTLKDSGADFVVQDGFDTHNTLTMAVDNSGHLHLAGNMHTEGMHYWRTRIAGDITSLTACGSYADERADDGICPGVMPVPPTFGDWTSGGRGKDGNTYPIFIRDDSGALFFTIRSGTSANGETYINAYDTTTQQWNGVDSEGYHLNNHAQPLLASNCWPCAAGESGAESAYHIIKHHDGRFHLAWMWRASLNGTDVYRSHDLSYAWSEDLIDWYPASVPNPTPGDALPWPIRPRDTSVVVDPLRPATLDIDNTIEERIGGGLHNSFFSLSFDAESRPVISYSRFDFVDAEQVDSVAVNARWESSSSEWRRTPIPLSNRCDQKSRNGVAFGPAYRTNPRGGIIVADDGTLSIDLVECEQSEKKVRRHIKLDPSLTPIADLPYKEDFIVPNELKELELVPTRAKFCGNNDNPEVNKKARPMTVVGRSHSGTKRGFFLRYYRVDGTSRFGRPIWCKRDTLHPGKLRLYEVEWPPH